MLGQVLNRAPNLWHTRQPQSVCHTARTRRRRSVQCKVAVGIDLGTTSSAIALIREEDGQPYVLEDEQGKAIIPSVVAYTPDGRVAVGRAAEDLLLSQRVARISDGRPEQPSNSGQAFYFYSTKRLMGKQTVETSSLTARLSYPVTAHAQGWTGLVRPPGVPQPQEPSQAAPSTSPDYSIMLPQEVAAHILRSLLERAEAHLRARQPKHQSASETQHSNGTVDHPTLYAPLSGIQEAVITVPAHFSAAARAAIIEAGRLAGLKRIQLLQEPIAAALAYGYGVGGPASSSYDTLLVFDLGGGTLDVSLLEGWDGILEVLMTDGDDELGGDDLTRALCDHLLQLAGSRPLSELPPHLRLAVTRCAESAKIELSRRVAAVAALHSSDDEYSPDPSHTHITVTLPQDLPPGEGQDAASVQQQVVLTAAAVDRVWLPLLQRLWVPLERLAVSSCLQFGGRLPEAIAVSKGNGEAQGTSGSGPGAKESGKVLSQHALFASDATTSNGSGQAKYAAAPRKLTGVVLVGAATRTPAVSTFMSQLCALPPVKGVDPEEAVALGAALQAGVLSGTVGRGAELTDGGYIAAEHGRSSGWSSDIEVEWQP